MACRDRYVRRRRPMKTRTLSLILACCFALTILVVSPAAQAAPVYVSSGTTVYVLSGGSFTAILTLAGANFESLATGPDNVDTDNAVAAGLGNPSHPFLLYACDTAGKVVRFDPAIVNANPALTPYQSVASGLAIAPICGRSTATGDFYVTDKSGPGV